MAPPAASLVYISLSPESEWGWDLNRALYIQDGGVLTTIYINMPNTHVCIFSMDMYFNSLLIESIATKLLFNYLNVLELFQL